MRRKWEQQCKNLQEGDVVLLKDKCIHRNEWPIGIIDKTYIGSDGHVREVEVRLGTNRKIFLRPASEVVVILSK